MTVQQSNPSFGGPGSLFGRIAAQWNQYFSAKVDAENGTADNLTVTGVFTVGGFSTAPLSAAAVPLTLSSGTISLTWNTGTLALDGSNHLTIANGGVANANLATMPALSVKGNAAVGVAIPSDLTPTQLTSLLNPFSSTLQGAAPASGGGTANFLRADGTWTTPVSASVPTGAVMAFASITPPAGWVNCDGSAINRTTFAALFAVIGTTYGAGNGSTTFNVPDMRGRTAAGYDLANSSGRLTGALTGGVSASAIGNTGGEQGHALTSGENATHSHTITDPSHQHTEGQEATFNIDYASGAVVTTVYALSGVTNPITNLAATGITIDNAGSGTDHNTVQPSIVLNWIIKT
jgi:microcystin-dependent protein